MSRNAYRIEAACARFVLRPDRFDVVVATHLFGDILSDLGPTCTGAIGIAPSANMNPERNVPSPFERMDRHRISRARASPIRSL